MKILFLSIALFLGLGVCAQNMASNSMNYWYKGKAINDEYTLKMEDLWFSSYRPTVVTNLFKDLALELRSLNTMGVDPLILDDINRKIVYYEYAADLTRNGKTKDWFAAIKDIMPGIEDLIGIKKMVMAPSSGFKENAEQSRIYDSIENLRMAELTCIRQMRAKYGIELPLW